MTFSIGRLQVGNDGAMASEYLALDPSVTTTSIGYAIEFYGGNETQYILGAATDFIDGNPYGWLLLDTVNLTSIPVTGITRLNGGGASTDIATFTLGSDYLLIDYLPNPDSTVYEQQVTLQRVSVNPATGAATAVGPAMVIPTLGTSGAPTDIRVAAQPGDIWDETGHLGVLVPTYEAVDDAWGIDLVLFDNTSTAPAYILQLAVAVSGSYWAISNNPRTPGYFAKGQDGFQVTYVRQTPDPLGPVTPSAGHHYYDTTYWYDAWVKRSVDPSTGTLGPEVMLTETGNNQGYSTLSPWLRADSGIELLEVDHYIEGVTAVGGKLAVGTMGAVTTLTTTITTGSTGWTPVLEVTDFSGGMPGSWFAYPDGWLDTSGNGHYRGSAGVSVHGTALNINLALVAGIPRSTALEPMPGGQLYGRFTIDMEADAGGIGGWKIANLLWPNSGTWPDDGEVDFPEGNLESDSHGFMHYANKAGGQDVRDTGLALSGRHVYSTEWSPGLIRFFVDGVQVGTDCVTDIPDKPMHWVIQCETNMGGIYPSAPANILVHGVKIETFGSSTHVDVITGSGPGTDTGVGTLVDWTGDFSTLHPTLWLGLLGQTIDSAPVTNTVDSAFNDVILTFEATMRLNVTGAVRHTAVDAMLHYPSAVEPYFIRDGLPYAHTSLGINARPVIGLEPLSVLSAYPAPSSVSVGSTTRWLASAASFTGGAWTPYAGSTVLTDASGTLVADDTRGYLRGSELVVAPGLVLGGDGHLVTDDLSWSAITLVMVAVLHPPETELCGLLSAGNADDAPHPTVPYAELRYLKNGQVMTYARNQQSSFESATGLVRPGQPVIIGLSLDTTTNVLTTVLVDRQAAYARNRLVGTHPSSSRLYVGAIAGIATSEASMDILELNHWNSALSETELVDAVHLMNSIYGVTNA